MANEQQTQQAQAAAQRYVRIHYHRPDEDYKDWGLHLWGDRFSQQPHNSWDEPYPQAGSDQYGVYYDVPVEKPAGRIRFNVYRGSEKDPDRDLDLDPDQTKEVWIYAGDRTIHQQPRTDKPWRETSQVPCGVLRVLVYGYPASGASGLYRPGETKAQPHVQVYAIQEQSGAALPNRWTGSDGTAEWSDLPSGTYEIRIDPPAKTGLADAYVLYGTGPLDQSNQIGWQPIRVDVKENDLTTVLIGVAPEPALLSLALYYQDDTGRRRPLQGRIDLVQDGQRIKCLDVQGRLDDIQIDRPGMVSIRPQPSVRDGCNLYPEVGEVWVLAESGRYCGEIYIDYVPRQGQIEVSTCLLDTQGNRTRRPLRGTSLELRRGGPAGDLLDRKEIESGPVLFEDLEPGNYTIRLARAPQLDGRRLEPVTPANGQVAVQVASGTTLPAEFCFQVCLSRLQGRVVDDSCGAGLQAVTVLLLDAEEFTELDRTTTNAMGAYEFAGLAPGRYVVALPSGQILVDGVEWEPAATAFEIGLERRSELDRRQISPALRSQFLAHGAVLTAQAEVTVEQAGSRWTIEDGDERYQIRAEKQALQVSVQSSGQRARMAVVADGFHQVADFRLVREIHRIRGVVRTGGGAPIGFAVVQILTADATPIALVHADGDGQYEWIAPQAGVYYLEAPQGMGGPIRRFPAVVNSDAEVDVITDGGGGASPAGLGGSTQNAIDQVTSFPFLTEEVDGSIATGGRSAAGQGQASQVVTRALRDVLGWRPKTTDYRGFLSALNQSFTQKEEEGRKFWAWAPRSYTVQVEAGAITGAQASIYTRAKHALDQSLPLLQGLAALGTDTDEEEEIALRSIVESEFTELVNELGYEGGPRIQRVDTLFSLLLGGSGDILSGHLGELEGELGLDSGNVNTVEEEQNLTNFLVLVDYVRDLQRSWNAQRTFFDRQGTDVFLGTQLVLIGRTLNVIAESVQETLFALDSVFLRDAERQATELQFETDDQPTVMLISELLDWTEHFAGEEGPRLIRDGGKVGVIALRPTADTLADLVHQAQTSPYGGHQDPNDVPSGYATARVQRALGELQQHLATLAELAEQLDADNRARSRRSRRGGRRAAPAFARR